jgi:hypothetical protein
MVAAPGRRATAYGILKAAESRVATSGLRSETASSKINPEVIYYTMGGHRKGEGPVVAVLALTWVLPLLRGSCLLHYHYTLALSLNI